MNIDHIAIWTEDLELEKDFFLKYFDCTANIKYVNSEKLFSSYFLTFSGGARIELMHRPDISGRGKPFAAGLAHIALDTGSRENVDSLTGILEHDGHIIHSRPRVTGDGYYESAVLDPEGNIIELISSEY